MKIEKERVNLLPNNEPDEKFGNVEIRLFRSYTQMMYMKGKQKDKIVIQGPIIETKRWTEKIEFFEKLDGIKKENEALLY